MSSDKQFSFDKDGSVHSVNKVRIDEVMKNGGASKYAETRAKQLLKMEREDNITAKTTAAEKNQRTTRTQRRTALRRSEEEAMEGMDLAASVQEHSLRVVSDYLEEKINDIETELSKIRTYRLKKP